MPGATMSMGWDQLSKYFSGMADKLERMSFRQPLADVAGYLAMEAKLNFDGQHAPDGTPWLPFQIGKATRNFLAGKSNRLTMPKGRGTNAKLLRDTDILMGSLIGQALGGSGQKHHEELTDWSLVWGTDVDYGGFHQDGTKYIPARPFIGLVPRMEDRIAQMLLWHVEDQLGFGGTGQQAA